MEADNALCTKRYFFRFEFTCYFESLQYTSIAVTFAGSIIVAYGDAGAGQLLGDVLALCGAMCSAVYTLIGRRLRQTMSTTMYTWIVYFFAGVIVTVFSLMNGTKMIGYGVKNLLVALGLAVLCTLLGHSIFSWGLKFERASFISTVEAAGIKADAFTETEGNPSVETVEKAKEQFLASGADFIVALGGGSPMDVAKAVGVVAKYGGSITEYEGGGKVPGDIIPLIVIPTTAGTGS